MEGPFSTHESYARAKTNKINAEQAIKPANRQWLRQKWRAEDETTHPVNDDPTHRRSVTVNPMNPQKKS